MKLFVIQIAEESSWSSVKIITKNLSLSYENLVGTNVIQRKLSRIISTNHLVTLVSEIIKECPDWIVFLDTHPVYGDFLRQLARQLNETKIQRPKIRFHVYGDFILNSKYWSLWQDSIKGFRAEWVCASDRQANLVRSFFIDRCSVSWVCPFPVEANEFTFKPTKREQIRKALNIKERDFVFLYSGRLSMQKNTTAICRAFSWLHESFFDTTHLILMGNFDDQGAPFNSTSTMRSGEFYHLWKSEFNRLPEKSQKRIRIIQSLAPKQVSQIYCASDAFISLSLQHDEDFGMAPAEAAVSGLPLILTDWGGYSGFKNMGFAGLWIPVKIESRGPEFDINDATISMSQLLTNRRSDEQRREFSELAKSKLNIKEVARIIIKNTFNIEPPIFLGFNARVGELNSDIGHNGSDYCGPRFSKFDAGSVYEKTYRHYVHD
ncbi:MAG: glycosyltransferase family 4 protein [Oligoflexia bacterium]|nr:glycosyltransferase family 4 protein [Oligoflexia bacterium]